MMPRFPPNPLTETAKSSAVRAVRLPFETRPSQMRFKISASVVGADHSGSQSSAMSRLAPFGRFPSVPDKPGPPAATGCTV